MLVQAFPEYVCCTSHISPVRITMTQALKENPLCPSARLEDQSVCWRFYWLCPTFVGSLLLHLMIVWWSHFPWWKWFSRSFEGTIYKNLACSNTCYGQNSVKYCKNVAQKTRCPTIQPLDCDKPIIVCYSSPASPLGVPSQAPSRFIPCPKIATGKNTSERTFPQWPKDANGFLGCAPQWVFT